MATVTLTGNTNYSALTLANDDTIDCAGFILTLDIQPTETGIQVTSPGTNGRIVFDDAWVIPTWDFFAGSSTTAGMIDTLPSGAEIGSITGGAVNNAYGVLENYGTIGESMGGTAGSCYGVSRNYGHVGTSTGGTGGSAQGIHTNEGTVDLAMGSISSTAHGVFNNSLTGFISAAIGGSGSGNGVHNNNAFVGTATGGTGGTSKGVSNNNGTVVSAVSGVSNVNPGIDINSGICLRITDLDHPAVRDWRGLYCFVEGPYINGEIPGNIKTIYSLGTLSGGATIAGDATVIEMELAGGGGGGGGPSRIRQGNLIGRSF